MGLFYRFSQVTNLKLFMFNDFSIHRDSNQLKHQITSLRMISDNSVPNP